MKHYHFQVKLYLFMKFCSKLQTILSLKHIWYKFQLNLTLIMMEKNFTTVLNKALVTTWKLLLASFFMIHHMASCNYPKLYMSIIDPLPLRPLTNLKHPWYSFINLDIHWKTLTNKLSPLIKLKQTGLPWPHDQLWLNLTAFYQTWTHSISLSKPSPLPCFHLICYVGIFLISYTTRP